MKWEVVIGLETHAQLSTASKIFSGASTAFGAAPNTQACAVDIALPGVLPVLNQGAVERAIRFGLAVGAKINRRSIFARKNYFYPDLPKGYQISQYELPIVEGGLLTVHVGETEKTVRLTRAHLEEDAGKSLHEDFHGATGIDLNRAGTPLLEIVTEPDMRSSAEAVAYAKALHALVRWIGICDGNMQEGSFRCDANVSVRPAGSDKLGTRAEIKNLNSFRFLEQAIEFEIRRQIEILEDGGKIVQETRLYDPDRDETRSMRSKEDAHDYRYFPDPDLLPLVVSQELIDDIETSLAASGTPKTRRMSYVHLYSESGFTSYDADLLTQSKEMSDYFDEVVKAGANPKLSANWISGELSNYLNKHNIAISDSPITPNILAWLIGQISDRTITAKNAKDVVFKDLWEGKVVGVMNVTLPLLQIQMEGGAYIKRMGLEQISDGGAIEKVVDDVIKANARQAADYRAGKDKAFNSLVGQVMKATQGKANPQQVSDILKRRLAG
jgi:aspartyl-tRNA(Asn)/glutamyl-tRNA(Gln) amidotransferase subunit B